MVMAIFSRPKGETGNGDALVLDADCIVLRAEQLTSAEHRSNPGGRLFNNAKGDFQHG